MFRPEKAPKINLAEVRHSSWYARGAVSLNLYESALFDLSEEVTLQQHVSEVKNGLTISK